MRRSASNRARGVMKRRAVHRQSGTVWEQVDRYGVKSIEEGSQMQDLSVNARLIALH